MKRWWCKLMHGPRSLMWPMWGRVRCRRCGEVFKLDWGVR